MSKVKLFSITVLLLSLWGCSSNHTAAINSLPVINPPPGTDPAQATLAEAATSVSKSMQSLEQMQQATTPLPDNLKAAPDPADYGMANPVTISWNGPIEPLLTQISDATGYRVRVLGKTPAIPILVVISAKNVPVGEVLRDAGYQCGDKATLIVFPHTHTIELRYATSA